MMDLSQLDITYVQGVGSRRAELLKRELGVSTAMDMLYVFPYKYIDRSRFYLIREIDDEDTFVQIRGTIVGMQTIGVGNKERLSVEFSDGYDTIELLWFSAAIKYIKPKLKANTNYILFGKPTFSKYTHRYEFIHPDLDVEGATNKDTYHGLEPYYNTSEKMKNSMLNTKAIRKIMQNLMPMLQNGVPETLGADILNRYHLLNLTQSLQYVHFPQSFQQKDQARARLKFEELFYIQLHILRTANRKIQYSEAYKMPRVGKFFNSFYYNNLPFQLTNAQKRVIHEIRDDLMSGQQMNRLLQGDVGSGKTLVALMVALLAADNGAQTCIMAPTEILANQHFQTISKFVEGLGINVALLTGSTTKKQRKILHEQLTDGTINILVGTHALIEDTVQFQHLGLAIIDEQHRFGVKQRSKLWDKDQLPPHILVMTATPIPRTLAMTVYGDLQVSVIDELPPGRKPIMTVHYNIQQHARINEFIHKQIQEGRQVYVVYPLITENKKLELLDLQNGYEYFCTNFPQYKICMVHGQMKAQEKDAQMQLFARGEAQIMVATTVIEVGVNVPNASVMIVENAERFGLSQLHQLRGRVGRGADQSYCILMTSQELSKDTRKRMRIMTETNDGFRIAEADLQLRGPGDLEGTQQSGLPFELHIASLATDGEILNLARQAAKEVLANDPTLENPINQVYIDRLKKLRPQIDRTDWGEIS
ncbi:MAG: ATP-dependent DNA helicase RecG [Paludibacteraceae bacterium]|nr:ATP-dependent DNA helicase RecG [Paludibacteraceae bacterium]